jgi:hypothetical protein
MCSLPIIIWFVHKCSVSRPEGKRWNQDEYSWEINGTVTILFADDPALLTENGDLQYNTLKLNKKNCKHMAWEYRLIKNKRSGSEGEMHEKN